MIQIENRTKRAMMEKMMTTLPITLLIMTMPLVSNLFLILSTSQVSPNHHSRAPKTRMLGCPTPISTGISGTAESKLREGGHEEEHDERIEESVTRNAVMPLCIRVPYLY